MLKEEINERWKAAFKARDNNLKSLFELIRAKILLEEKSGKYALPLNDDIIQNIILKEVKEMKETQSYHKKDSQEYLELDFKINVLNEYLPKQFTEEEVKSIIKGIISASGETNLGKIIGLTVKEIGNNFDKSKISPLVKEVINK